MSGSDSWGGMSTAIPTNWADFQSQAQASQTPEQWMAEQQAAAQRNGGDGGTVIRPEDYAAAINYTLPGQQGNWSWDAAHNQYMQPEGAWNLDGVTNANVIHNDGGQGVAHDNIQVDGAAHGWEHFADKVMPAATMAIIAGISGGTLGPYMAAAGAEGGAAAGSAEAGLAADGLGAEGTAIGGSSSAAPTFTYGQASPWTWSQSGGTELGSGLYGTDPGSMAGTFGTTAGGATGEVGSALGSGIAADGGAWAGAGGGWQSMLAEAGAGGGGLSLADALKYGKNAYSTYQALAGAGAGGKGSIGGGQSVGGSPSIMGGMGGGSAPGFSSSVQMAPEQHQASTPLTMLQTPQFTNPAAPAKEKTPDEINNSANILRLAQALRGQTA